MCASVAILVAPAYCACVFLKFWEISASVLGKFRFQKADDSFVAGMTCIYWKVVFFLNDANNITRLAGTILRPGTKFFMCLKR